MDGEIGVQCWRIRAQIEWYVAHFTPLYEIHSDLCGCVRARQNRQTEIRLLYDVMKRIVSLQNVVAIVWPDHSRWMACKRSSRDLTHTHFVAAQSTRGLWRAAKKNHHLSDHITERLRTIATTTTNRSAYRERPAQQNRNFHRTHICFFCSVPDTAFGICP